MDSRKLTGEQRERFHRLAKEIAQDSIVMDALTRLIEQLVFMIMEIVEEKNGNPQMGRLGRVDEAAERTATGD